MLPGMYTKSEATIANILATARTRFLGQNYAEVSMDAIAETAGVTKGALYHHFANKESLYVAMLTADLQSKRDLFRPAVASPGPCRGRLRRLTQVFLDLDRDQRDLIKLVRRDINIFKDPVRAKLVRAYQAALPEQIEIIIRDGIRSGELAPADPRLLSWLYVGLVEVVLTRYAGRVFKDPTEILEFVADLFFMGAARRPSSTRRNTPSYGKNVHQRKLGRRAGRQNGRG